MLRKKEETDDRKRHGNRNPISINRVKRHGGAWEESPAKTELAVNSAGAAEVLSGLSDCQAQVVGIESASSLAVAAQIKPATPDYSSLRAN